MLERAPERSALSPELRSLCGSALAIEVFVVLTAAGMVGFGTASLVAVLAATGFAVQGSSSNLAAGILILALRPFRVGERIGVGEAFGRMLSIQILRTVVVSPGEKTLIVPDAEIVGGVVTNYSARGVIRPELEALLRGVLAEASHVLAGPAPEVGIANYDSHNVVVAVRPYVAPDDYWPATFEVNRRVKAALHAAGVPMAYSEGVELGEIGA